MALRERKVEWVELMPAEIAEVARVDWVRKGSCEVLRGVFTDTRYPAEGGLFFGLSGEQFDGSLFAQDAVDAGAKGVVIRDGVPLPDGDVHLFRCPDPLFVFGELARAHREKAGAAVIAITGSLGKTTTKEMTGRILTGLLGNDQAIVSEGNLNNLVGLPLNLFRLRRERAMVVELGTNRFGELARLTEIAAPNLVVITAIAPVHLEFFGDVRGVLRAKWELIERAGDDVTAVLNRDDELLVEQAAGFGGNIVWFGAHPDSDVRLVDLELMGFAGSRIVVEAEGNRAECEIKAAGRHQAMNALCALAIACAWGLNLADAARALHGFEPLELRGRIVRKGGWLIIDDSYNASPDAVKRALEMLSFGVGERVAVIGHMRELGDAAGPLHFEVGKSVAEAADILVAVGDFAEETKRGAVFVGMDEANIFVASDWRDALDIVESVVSGEATILVKGSRLVGLDRLVGALEEG